MRHSPGIQPADVEELLAHGAAAVVLSQGIDKRLQVDPATLQYLQRQSVEVHVAGTPEAAQIYNELASTTSSPTPSRSPGSSTQPASPPRPALPGRQASRGMQ